MQLSEKIANSNMESLEEKTFSKNDLPFSRRGGNDFWNLSNSTINSDDHIFWLACNWSLFQ
jgi:hypothetical protein